MHNLCDQQILYTYCQSTIFSIKSSKFNLIPLNQLTITHWHKHKTQKHFIEKATFHESTIYKSSTFIWPIHISTNPRGGGVLWIIKKSQGVGISIFWRGQTHRLCHQRQRAREKGQHSTSFGYFNSLFNQLPSW